MVPEWALHKGQAGSSIGQRNRLRLREPHRTVDPGGRRCVSKNDNRIGFGDPCGYRGRTMCICRSVVLNRLLELGLRLREFALCRGDLTFAPVARLFKVRVSLHVRNDAGLLARLLKAPQGLLKRLIVLNQNPSHMGTIASFLRRHCMCARSCSPRRLHSVSDAAQQELNIY